MVHRSMALVATTSLAADGRGAAALDEHEAIVRAIEARDGAAAEAAIRAHISHAFETRLKRSTPTAAPEPGSPPGRRARRPCSVLCQ